MDIQLHAYLCQVRLKRDKVPHFSLCGLYPAGGDLVVLPEQKLLQECVWCRSWRTLTWETHSFLPHIQPGTTGKSRRTAELSNTFVLFKWVISSRKGQSFWWASYNSRDRGQPAAQAPQHPGVNLWDCREIKSGKNYNCQVWIFWKMTFTTSTVIARETVKTHHILQLWPGNNWIN